MPTLRNEDAKSRIEHTILSPPPRTTVFSTNPKRGVEIIMGEGDLEGAEPITVGQSLRAAVEKYPDFRALGYKDDGEWKYISYPEYYQLCISAAKSFHKVGISLLQHPVKLSIKILVSQSVFLCVLLLLFGTYAHTFVHQLGLEEFHGVAIIGFNSPEWIIANLGAILAG